MNFEFDVVLYCYIPSPVSSINFSDLLTLKCGILAGSKGSLFSGGAGGIIPTSTKKYTLIYRNACTS